MLSAWLKQEKETDNMVKLALFARIQAKPERAEEVAKLLESALALAKAEPGTVHWFGPTTFGAFDTFEAEADEIA
jgi:hypothetical protein